MSQTPYNPGQALRRDPFTDLSATESMGRQCGALGEQPRPCLLQIMFEQRERLENTVKRLHGTTDRLMILEGSPVNLGDHANDKAAVATGDFLSRALDAINETNKLITRLEYIAANLDRFADRVT